MTDGNGIKLKNGGVEESFAELAGAPRRLVLANRQHDTMLRQALSEWSVRMGGKIDRLWIASAGAKQSGMRYVSLVITGSESAA